MPSLSSQASPDPEGIDAIVDSVVANPKRADHAKKLLRDSMAQRKAILPFPRTSQAANDDDDMWDNVPV